jgi:hypothetical protein
MSIGPDVIDQILDVIKYVVAGVMGADPRSGPFKMVREMGALAGFLRESSEQFKDNPLVSQVISALTAKPDEDAGSQAGQPEPVTLSITDILGKADSLNSLLASIPGGDDVKRFIYQLAEKIASASGSGLFGSGPKISGQEANFLERLKNTLGI